MNKTALLSTLLYTSLAAGCGDDDTQQRLAANKAVVQRAQNDVWSSGKLEVADELYASDYVAHWTLGSDTRGLEEFKKLVREWRTSFPDWNEQIEQIVAEGDLVVTRFISSGTFKGDLLGIPPNGKSTTVQEVAIHRIVDGKIVEQWTVADDLGMQRQLDIVFPESN